MCVLRKLWLEIRAVRDEIISLGEKNHILPHYASAMTIIFWSSFQNNLSEHWRSIKQIIPGNLRFCFWNYRYCLRHSWQAARNWTDSFGWPVPSTIDLIFHEQLTNYLTKAKIFLLHLVQLSWTTCNIQGCNRRGDWFLYDYSVREEIVLLLLGRFLWYRRLGSFKWREYKGSFLS